MKKSDLETSAILFSEEKLLQNDEIRRWFWAPEWVVPTYGERGAEKSTRISHFEEVSLHILLSRIGKKFWGSKTELEYETDFQFLIAVMLSAQTTDRQVNVVTRTLFVKIRSAQDILFMGLADLTKSIRSINYFNTKAKHIFASAQIIDQEFAGRIPDTIDSCLKLPGVGIKTAKVVLSVLYNAPYVWVDTHVHRVCNRIGIVKTHTPQETDRELEQILSEEEKIMAHHPLVLFWRYQCMARKPKCSTCVVSDLCRFYGAQQFMSERAKHDKN